MNPASLKSRIESLLWEAARRDKNILSATLAGSFLEEASLEGISDIDLVVVVDRLNAAGFDRLVRAFDLALRGELASLGYGLRVNPTLGPLKFNEPATAVLHLMLYSREAHVAHALASPFTCFDWQRSAVYCKQSLAEVFPVFNLQPHHFMSARRSVRDYLRDFDAGVVSYRELVCDDHGYEETPRSKPMTERDRHEFAYHIVKFLMQNLVKLVRRANLRLRGEALLAEYFLIFPENEAELRALFDQLQTIKRGGDFTRPLSDLDARLHAFIDVFERQFRREFFDESSRHVALRHGPTAANGGARHERIFLGSSDPPLLPIDASTWRSLAEGVRRQSIVRAFASPLARCRQTLTQIGALAALPPIECDSRLREIDYGRLEGLTVSASRAAHGGLFAAWQRGEDPKFPGGENTHDVATRALAFVGEQWRADAGDSLTCTHNVVLRCLVGHVLGLPPHQWHRLEVPHLAPITFIATRRHGLFVDVPNDTAHSMFADFATLPRIA